MHAFLVVGPEELVNPRAEEIIKKLASQKMVFDIQKIADVRELKDFLKINLPSKTTIIVNNFSEATSDAQNAFLKELEEPQEKLSYILTSNSLENILPTIVSRCELIELQNSKGDLPQEVEREIVKFIEGSVGEKLKTISIIKDRKEALSFLENILKVGHKQLLTGTDVGKLLESTRQTISALKANGNIQLQLTNLVVKLDS